MDRSQTLKDAYSDIAELWCSPPEEVTEQDEIKKKAEEVVERLKGIDKDGARLLSRFLAEDVIADEDYIDLFELDPQCPLYLGSHTYEEPKTCANAAVSDRNEYMIELGGIYSHFGRKPNGTELPDYLPMMIEFLSLTADRDDDPIRDKYIEEFILPFLPPIRGRLEQLNSPYIHLLDGMEKVINSERKKGALKESLLNKLPLSKQREQKVESYVG
mgnify:FL=1